MKNFNDRKPTEKSPEKALETLRWLCSKMERCRSDVRKSLVRWNVPRDKWDEIIEKLIEDKFVDDERYASAYIREKISTSGWGKVKIINGLILKGVEKDIIDRAVSELIDPEEMNDKLSKFISARIPKEATKAKSPYDLRARLFRAAAGRGFDFEQINRQLDMQLRDDE